MTLPPDILAERARRILSDEAFEVAVARARERISRTILASEPEAREAREALYHQARSMDLVSRELRAMADEADLI